MNLNMTAKSIPNVKLLCEELGFPESVEATKYFKESCRTWTDNYRTSSDRSGKELTEWKAPITKQELHSMSLSYLEAHGHDFWPPVVDNMYHYPADTDLLVNLLSQLFYRFNSNRRRYEQYGPFKKSVDRDWPWMDPESPVSTRDESLPAQSSGSAEHGPTSKATEAKKDSQNTEQNQGNATFSSDETPTSSYNLRGRHNTRLTQSHVYPRILGQGTTDLNPSPPSRAHAQHHKSLVITLKVPQLARLVKELAENSSLHGAPQESLLAKPRPKVSHKRLPSANDHSDNTILAHDHLFKRHKVTSDHIAVAASTPGFLDFQSSSSARSSRPLIESAATEPSEELDDHDSFITNRRVFSQSSEMQLDTKAVGDRESAPPAITTDHTIPQRHVPQNARLTVLSAVESPFCSHVAPIAPMTRDLPRVLQPLSQDSSRTGHSMPPNGAAPSSQVKDLGISESNKPNRTPADKIGVVFHIIKARVPRLRTVKWVEGKLGGKSLESVIESIAQIVESDQIEKLHFTLQTWEKDAEVTILKGDEVEFERLKNDYKKDMREALDGNTKQGEDFKIWIEPILSGERASERLATDSQTEVPDF